MRKKNSKNKKLKGKGGLIGIIIIISIIILYIVLNSIYDFNRFFNVEYTIKYIDSAGFLGPLLFMILMAIAIVISPIPSLPLSAGAGAVWGPVLATLYSSIGALIGAIIAFLIARHFGRGFVEKHFQRQIRICYKCSDKYLFWIVFVSRFFPFFQFDIISYGAGLTNMKLRNFAIATYFGMLPMTYVFALLGKSIVFGKMIIIIASLVVIAGFFVVPIAIEKYNFLGMKGKIILQDKK